MKKIIIFAAILAVCLVFTACEDVKNENKSGDISNVEVNNNVVVEEKTTLLKDSKSIFTDNICLALAHLEFDNEGAIIDKYFDNELYNNIKVYNLSDDLSEIIDKYVFIPKDESVQVYVATCSINEDGTLKEENVVIDGENQPFKLYFNNYESIMPQYIIRYKVGEFEDSFPLVLSGYDGSVSIIGHEMEVSDITIYND